jgi:hypothetical protein
MPRLHISANPDILESRNHFTPQAFLCNPCSCVSGKVAEKVACPEDPGLEDLPIERMIEIVRKAFCTGWSQFDSVTWEAPRKSFHVYDAAVLSR